MNNTRLTLDKKEWIKGALIGTFLSGLLSYMVNYFIVGMPVTAVENATNNAASGAISALLTGLVGTFVYVRAVRQKQILGKNTHTNEEEMVNQSIEAKFQPDSTMQPLPEHVTEALNAGWIDHSKGLRMEDANDLLKPGYLPMETGYTRFPDGKIQVSCLTKMPGCKGRMVNWWFGWMANSTHYQWWHPKEHGWSGWEKGNQSRDNNPDNANYIGDAHLVHETIGGETSELRIQFRDPSEYLDTSRFSEANVGAAICARCGYLDKPLKIAHMIHFVRDTDDGCEMRSRFWAGDVEITIPVMGAILGKLINTNTMRKRVIPESLGEGLMLHCAEEMNHLSSFLPDLFHKMTDKKMEV